MKALALFGMFVLATAFIGCSHPISQGLRDTLDPALTFDVLNKEAKLHLGSRVMLGGEIVETRILNEGSEIELVQKDLDCLGYPETGDSSQGRYIFKSSKFLEPQIYSKGRRITGVGTIRASHTGKVGEAAYDFPVIELEELHLWEEYSAPVNPYLDPFYYPSYRSPFLYRTW
ncbi:MAG: hypothetical protein G3M78_09195 [Candidatus Nitrohelix vancouverensis]|uniref:Outer membrane lipoprotein Slp n=1 Tax=Candidatus Nitrohelix vancouverensis TaxID=2705534 RepID=A0A7T0C366_9BACT|nr:MAG: hypothetical protein G3M78_09195 [Candidatus Nitrohelix vancouverensis]